MVRPLELEASLVRIGFAVDYFDKSAVERWADRQIAVIEVPPIELLDLSILRNTHPLEVRSLLGKLCGVGLEENYELALGFLGLMLSEGRIDLRVVIRSMYQLTLDIDIALRSEIEQYIYYLDDADDGALAGWGGSLDSVRIETLEFLEPFVTDLQEQHADLVGLASDRCCG